MFSLQNIKYRFPHTSSPLLKNIHVDIPQGSMLAIMGLNGSGKTTLLKILSGYLQPSEGVMSLNSVELKQISAKEIAQKIAFVPQDFPTDFPFKVFDFVMMGRFCWQNGLFNEQRDIEKVNEVLERLHLSDFRDRLISKLSGGEKQRVLLARALAQESQTILLDEPANHLDIKNKLEILNIVRHENQNHNKTIVAVMHDFNDVKKYFKTVIFLKEGQIEFVGGTTEVMNRELVKHVFEIDYLPELA